MSRPVRCSRRWRHWPGQRSVGQYRGRGPAETGLSTAISGLVPEAADSGQGVYLWADGIYSGARATRNQLCALVVIGINVHGGDIFQPFFPALEDGTGESALSWREVLLKLKSRGIKTPRPAGVMAYRASGRSLSMSIQTLASAVPGAQDGKCTEYPAATPAVKGESRAAEDLDDGDPGGGFHGR